MSSYYIYFEVTFGSSQISQDNQGALEYVTVILSKAFLYFEAECIYYILIKNAVPLQESVCVHMNRKQGLFKVLAVTFSRCEANIILTSLNAIK